MSSAPSPAAVGTRLADRFVAVSVSRDDDLPQMGLPADQIPRALQAILVPLVADGARIGYGGRITVEGDNYTQIISNQLAEAYRRLEQAPGSRPFVHFVAQHRLANTPVAELLGHLKLVAPYGEIWVTGPDGVLGTLVAATSTSDEVAACEGCGLQRDADLQVATGEKGLAALPLYRSFVAKPVLGPNESFTAMRTQMARSCDVRVQLGGRKTDFSGPISGLCEEALLTIAAGKPLYVLGGFGGASRDIAIELGVLGDRMRVPRVPEHDETRYFEGLRQVNAARSAYQSLYTADELSALADLARTESVLDASELLLMQLAARLGS